VIEYSKDRPESPGGEDRPRELLMASDRPNEQSHSISFSDSGQGPNLPVE